MSILAEFLKRNTIGEATALPLVHSTQAIFLKKLMESNKIVPSWCDVFRRDTSYFFVGRPGYKHRVEDREIGYWQLPACFIFEFEALCPISRIYPFDSGAHHNKRMPEFIQMIDKGEYELPGTPEAVRKIIGAFFSTPADYFMLKPKSGSAFGAEFSLSVFDEEIKALHMLASVGSSEKLDDRRLCIEIQTEESVPLIKNKLLAVVCPHVYLDDPLFRHHVEDVWQAEPLSYNIFPLSYEHYISTIYETVLRFYQDKGIL